MGETPTISVVIPTSDRLHLLGRAVDSVLGQTFHDYEIIIVDDGTCQRVPSHSFSDRRISVVATPGARGPGAARNRGIEGAVGKYIAFLDDDDHWLPAKLEVSLEALARHPEAGVVFHHTGRPGEPILTNGTERVHQHPAVMFATRQTPHIDSVMVRREILGNIRFSEELPAAAEVDLLLRVAKTCPFAEIGGTYAIFDPSPVAPSSIGLEARIDARRRIVADHPDVFASREAQAFGASRLGHLYRRSGQRGAAIRCFLNAIRLDPTSNEAWTGLVSSVALRPRRG